MPQRCRVCHSPDRASLDAQLLKGVPVPVIAAETTISMSALYRHQKNHLLAPAAAALRERQADYLTYGNSVLEELNEMEKDLKTVMGDLRNSGNISLFLQANQQRREVLKLKAQLTHQLATAPQTNITLIQNPAWVEIKDVLLRTLKRYPDALRELQSNLKALTPPSSESSVSSVTDQ